MEYTNYKHVMKRMGKPKGIAAQKKRSKQEQLAEALAGSPLADAVLAASAAASGAAGASVVAVDLGLSSAVRRKSAGSARAATPGGATTRTPTRGSTLSTKCSVSSSGNASAGRATWPRSTPARVGVSDTSAVASRSCGTTTGTCATTSPRNKSSSNIRTYTSTTITNSS